MNRTLGEFKEAVLFLADDMSCLEEYQGLTLTEESLPEIVTRLVIQMFVVGYSPSRFKDPGYKPVHMYFGVKAYMNELQKYGEVRFKEEPI